MTTLEQHAATWERTLVDLLVASGAADEDVLVDALDGFDRRQAPIGALLARRGIVSAEVVARCLASITGVEFVDLVANPPSTEAFASVDVDLGFTYHLLGYDFDGDGLVLAIAEPLEGDARSAVVQSIGRRIAGILLADALVIDDLLTRRSAQPGGGAVVSVSARRGATFDDLLLAAVQSNASDLHLTADARPAIRVNGAIRPMADFEELTGTALSALLFDILSPEQRERFERTFELDASYRIDGVGRFRLSVFRQRGQTGAAVRVIPQTIPSLDSLGLPPVVAQLADLRRGLVLITGPTGSGKSTTLAALVERINAARPLHIITVEDPIEYEHQNRASIVNQREVGLDTLSFADSLRHALRQDPDVILIGEMRDLETISTALTAAETGHLVLSTLHTPDAPQTLERIIDAFPASQQDQVRLQLAGSLEAVVTQQLVIDRSGLGRVAVAEVLRVTPAVRNLIRSGKTHQIDSLIQAGGELGMQTMDLALARAVSAGAIAEEVALDRAHDPEELRSYLRDLRGALR